ncbi:hypothetical protein RRG08_047223 [Elysia crispata]|uniref:Uncharacterized protein n=1 Tax=Elysia crispata TaxID=231223 RepID=A0AAE1EC52_9GAST|nr:hypothetical protein RRG08_047223 [Elysia crispata]
MKKTPATTDTAIITTAIIIVNSNTKPPKSNNDYNNCYDKDFQKEETNRGRLQSWSYIDGKPTDKPSTPQSDSTLDSTPTTNKFLKQATVAKIAGYSFNPLTLGVIVGLTLSDLPTSPAVDRCFSEASCQTSFSCARSTDVDSFLWLVLFSTVLGLELK